MKIILLGATGQLGSEVLPLLQEGGAGRAALRTMGPLGPEVLPLLQDSQVVAPTSAELDITDEEAVMEAVRQAEPEVVINCAAMTDVEGCETNPERAFAVNKDGVRHLAEACKKVGAHLTTISSDYVFDGTKQGPYVETDEVNPLSVYGQSKVLGESCLGDDSTVVRTSWLNGSIGNNMVKKVLKLLATEGAEMKFVTDQVGNPTFASDLAPMVVNLSIEKRRGTFHVTNQGAVSWFEFARSVAETAGADVERILPCTTAELQPKVGRPANSVLDNSKLVDRGWPLLRHYSEPLAELVAQLNP